MPMMDLAEYFNTGDSYSRSTRDGVNSTLHGSSYADVFKIPYAATNFTSIVNFNMDADTIQFTGVSDTPFDLSIVPIEMDGDNTDAAEVEMFMWNLVGDYVQTETPGDIGYFLIGDEDSVSCVRLDDSDSNGYYTPDEYSVVFDVEGIRDVSGLADLVIM